ncbi:3-phosphoshikimate 1-carboxyvinyltransferase [Euhalothece natronophila Z-M001]|uniref:3-phosphoshikimate 1-carboxyvinyltransferase n=1 Tax=Euhalothece natronophila Z-M001 TaxID=522448 RepID=A0A5B8NR03_9CHRO|nr:3-phosphoshikimate 1-carboxyvinyltransferase [Euhalothece natronophila]QDZ40709.1 3-phosphoshikimate 1-carboxyvinyltransferase [Euhalothece natronophila Z-M001]
MPPSIITVQSVGTQQQLVINPPEQGLTLQGNLTIPGDKSISHRALMFGAIALGETRIQGLLLGEDPRSTAHCLRAMGAQISELNAQEVIIQGVGLGNLEEPSAVLDAGNSGTTVRLMLGLLASHASRFFVISGDASLRSRPMSRVVKPLTEMGAKIWGRQRNSLAPLAIQGESLKAITYHSPIASAQVKSCVLLAGLMAEGNTTVVEPALSRDHSERMLEAFGANITTDPEAKSITIEGKPTLKGQTIVVPGDISSAAFWLVAAIIVPDSELVIENVGINPTRTGILEALERMEADITIENKQIIAGEPVADLRVRSGQLKGAEIGGDLIPRLIDEIPIIAVAAIFAQGKTIIKDAAELRVKESDRIAVMASQLSKMGANITERPDGLEINGGGELKGTELEAYNDHRVAMSCAIAALKAKGKTTINGAEAVAISYPDFFDSLRQICETQEI